VCTMLLKGRTATAKKYRRHHGKSGARSAAGKCNLAIVTYRNSQNRRAALSSARSLLPSVYIVFSPSRVATRVHESARAYQLVRCITRCRAINQESVMNASARFKLKRASDMRSINVWVFLEVSYSLAVK